MSVAAAVRLYPVQPLPREAATVSAGEFCGPQQKWMPAPLLKLYHLSVRPLQRTKS